MIRDKTAYTIEIRILPFTPLFQRDKFFLVIVYCLDFNISHSCIYMCPLYDLSCWVFAFSDDCISISR